MRGEETQIAGALSLMPGFDGVLCLPGTHSKWAQICAGEVVSFQTFMTGEMFALLSEQSVLRHGLQARAGMTRPLTPPCPTPCRAPNALARGCSRSAPKGSDRGP